MTTGILVFSAAGPLHVTITHNVIFGDEYGVWLGINGNVTVTRNNNSFHNVLTHFFTFS